MGGDGAAGFGDMDLIKVHNLADGFFNQVDQPLIDPGMGDKYMPGIDIRITGQLVFRIFHKNVFQAAALFLSHMHCAASVVHFYAGLQIQYTGP